MNLNFLITGFSFLICVIASSSTENDKSKRMKLIYDYISLRGHKESGDWEDYINDFAKGLKALEKQLHEHLTSNYSKSYPTIAGKVPGLTKYSLPVLMKLQKRLKQSLLEGQFLTIPEVEEIVGEDLKGKDWFGDLEDKVAYYALLSENRRLLVQALQQTMTDVEVEKELEKFLKYDFKEHFSFRKNLINKIPLWKEYPFFVNLSYGLPNSSRLNDTGLPRISDEGELQILLSEFKEKVNFTHEQLSEYEQLKKDFISVQDQSSREELEKFGSITLFMGPSATVKSNMKAKLLQDFHSFCPSIGYNAQLSKVKVRGLIKLQRRAIQSIFGEEFLTVQEAVKIINPPAKEMAEVVEVIERVLSKYALMREILSLYAEILSASDTPFTMEEKEKILA